MLLQISVKLQIEIHKVFISSNTVTENELLKHLLIAKYHHMSRDEEKDCCPSQRTIH